MNSSLSVMQSLEQQGKVDIVGSEQDDDGMWSIKLKIKRKYGCAKVALR
jgi:hypothetical protein